MDTNKQITFTESEQQVFDLLAKGASNKVIANTINLAEITVKHHVNQLFKKLGCTNRVQVAIYAALNTPRLDNLTEEDEHVIFMIALRAQRQSLTGDASDTFSCFKWLCFAHSKVGALRLTELLNATNYYFFRDVKGILKNLNKSAKKYDNQWLPHYSVGAGYYG